MNTTFAIMVELVPTIHVFAGRKRVQDVDARHKGEHDGWSSVAFMGSELRPSACTGMTAGFLRE